MVRSTPLLRFAQAVSRTLTQTKKQSYPYAGGYGGSGGGGGGGWGTSGGSYSSGGNAWGGGGGGDRMGALGGGLKTIDWGSQRLEKFEKNFYVEDKVVSARTDSEIEAFRRLKQMRVCLFSASAQI
jgi:ATP-dependent RNA helicase DDX5/DBP2